MDYYSLFWGVGVISTSNKPWGRFTCRSSTLVVLADSGPFRGLLLKVLGSQSDFHSCWTPRCAYVSVINTLSFGPILARFVDYYSLFWGPGVISTIDEPGARLHVSHQHSRFLSMLNRFMDYYSTFWGPRAISMVIEPQGAFTCRSSTLTDLADSGPFRGLLLTVFGP